MQRVALKIRDATCDILDIDIGEDPMSCVVTRHMLLPHRCGGWGVWTHPESTSGSAHLSATALTEKALQKGNPNFLPFSGPSGGLCQDTHTALQVVHSDPPALSLDAVVNDIPSLQTQVMQAQDEAMLQILQSVFQEQCNSESTTERIRGEQILARMHSVIDSGASKFMDAMPFVFNTQVNDHQYESGVWNYLGLSVSPVNPGSLR